MTSRTIIEHLACILTGDGENREIRDGALVIEEDRLAAVGSTDEIRRKYPPSSGQLVIQGQHFVATPGFVDTHVHLHESLARAWVPDSLTTKSWVLDWIMPFYGAMKEEDERVSVIVGILELLRSGTTCFLDMGTVYDTGIVARAVGELGLRGVSGHYAADTLPDPVPSHWTSDVIDRHFFVNTDAALTALEENVRTWHGYADGRMSCWVNIQGKEPCSPELHVGARELADKLGVGTSYHLASSLEEAELSQKLFGRGPIERIAELGGLGSNVVLAHAVAASEEEIQLLAQYDTKVAFCPGSCLKLAKGATTSRLGRYPEMQRAGVTVGLGSDGASSSGSLNLMRQMYLAAGLFKDARLDETMLGARKAFRMATIEGARLLGWEEDVGSLEAGKKADFVLFDLRHPEWTPFGDAVQALVWSASPASIVETWVDGVCLYREGSFTAISDIQDLYAQARAISASLFARAMLPTSPVLGPSHERPSRL